MIRSLVVILVLAPLSLWAEDKPVIALKGHDPVELCGGKEVAGSAEITHKQGRYTYHFANAETLKAFQKAPDKYAIQFGGACMNMGPLSGNGNPDRYHVHKNRIYVFASDSCLKSFLTNPDGLIDTDDEVPTGTAEQSAQAKRLLTRAVNTLVGKRTIDALKTWEMKLKFVSTNEKNKYEFTRTLIAHDTSTYIVVDDFGTSKFTWKLRPDGGFMSWEPTPAATDVRAYMAREMARQPVMILKAFAGGKLVAFDSGKAKVGETEVEMVDVHRDGATTTLGIDPKTGTILTVSFKGRGGIGLNPIERRYSDFKSVDGFTLPHALTTFVNDKLQDQMTVTVEHVKVNGDVSEHLKK